MPIFKTVTNRLLDIMGRARRALWRILPRDNRACRVCACTQNDCRNCMGRKGMACWWVDASLCSACATALDPSDIRAAHIYARAVSLAHIQSELDPVWQQVMVEVFLSVRRGLAANPEGLTVCDALRVSQVLPRLTLNQPGNASTLPEPLSPLLPEPLRGAGSADEYDLSSLMPLMAPSNEALRRDGRYGTSQNAKENG